MIERLVEIMVRLRDPETGCAWDVAQDFATIAPYTIAMTGVASSGGIVVSADDTGSSFVVELTPAERTAVLAQIAELGVSRELLVVFEG